MIYHVRIKLKPDIDHNKVFEGIQNGANFYDNCVIEYSKPPEIVVEGHIRDEVMHLYEHYKTCLGSNSIKSSSYVTEDIITSQNIAEILFEEHPDADTILGDRREKTGFLMVRTAEYYERILEKILGLKEVLPTLIGLDKWFDERIAERLSK